jgi:hypothetical protein
MLMAAVKVLKSKSVWCEGISTIAHYRISKLNYDVITKKKQAQKDTKRQNERRH